MDRSGNLRRTAYLIIAAVLSCFGRNADTQQRSPRLISNQVISLHGKLRIAHRGFISYVLLDTGKTYIADGGKDEGTKKVALIEINSNGNQSLLASHAGEEVTVQGKLFVEFAAPVPYNGVIFEHATVTLANGTLVKPAPKTTSYTPPMLPATLTRYMVTRTMIPNSLHGVPDTAIDLDTGRSLPQGNPGYCVLSGAQDFMSCACAEGFAPVRSGLVQRPFPPDQWMSIPAADVSKELRAVQFNIPEGVRHPVHIQLVCEREAGK